MTEPIHILSEGGGVQSSTMDIMSDRGLILPRPKARIFADTKDEPKAVYAWIEKLKALTQTPFVEVSKGSLMDDALEVRRSGKSGKLYIKALIPAFVLNADGSNGLMGRRCTSDYKIDMIVRHVRKMIGKEAFLAWKKKHRAALKAISNYNEFVRAYKKAKKEGNQFLSYPDYPHWANNECQADPLCVMWIGISTDEADRMKPNKQPWIKTRWPIIELGMSRNDCLAWLKANGFDEPPRSACMKCPFHSDDEWIRQRDFAPDEFAESVKFDYKLREVTATQEQLKGMPYLHSSCVPLDKVILIPSAPGRQQLYLFSNECEGLCGV